MFDRLIQSIESSFSDLATQLSRIPCTVMQFSEEWRLKAQEKAKVDAKKLLEKTKADLEKWDDATKARSRKWFGDDSEETRQLMLKRVKAELNKLDELSAAKDFVPAEQEQQDCYAYVYPDKEGKVYLGNSFWTAPATGPNSKAGTLIHEMSHFNSVGATDDVEMSNGETAYGLENCEELAKEDKEAAKKNADSFEYFVEGD